MSKTYAQLFTSPRGAVWYHSKCLEVATIVSIRIHVSVQQICRNHAVGIHTVGVKVNADDTEIYVSP